MNLDACSPIVWTCCSRCSVNRRESRRKRSRRLGIDCEAVSRSLRDTVSRDESSRNYVATLEKEEFGRRQMAGPRRSRHRTFAAGPVRDSAQRRDRHAHAVRNATTRHLRRGAKTHRPRRRLAALAGRSPGDVIRTGSLPGGEGWEGVWPVSARRSRTMRRFISGFL